MNQCYPCSRVLGKGKIHEQDESEMDPRLAAALVAATVLLNAQAWAGKPGAATATTQAIAKRAVQHQVA